MGKVEKNKTVPCDYQEKVGHSQAVLEFKIDINALIQLNITYYSTKITVMQ